MTRPAGQKEFLLREFHALAARGALQRAGVYRDGVQEAARLSVRQDLGTLLDEVSLIYSAAVPDTVHVAAISRICDDLSRRQGPVLQAGRFRFGVAQKALNLFLKYEWCAGWIPAPPHCPFDARVIGRLPGCHEVRWTQLDDADAYGKLVEAARAVAAPKGLAEWELALWNAT